MTAWSSLDSWTDRRVERCRIERPLGRGGHAQIYLAFDEELRERRVLKVALPGLNEEELRAFLDEGLILSRLKHPQIVTLRSQGEFEGRRYMLLDYIVGHSVREVLARSVEHLDAERPWNSLLPPRVATALALSAARALAYAHAARLHWPDRDVQGLAHRDISPGNLILGTRGDERGRVVLIDFGTAKTDLDTLRTMRQGLSGTVPYMSKARLQRSTASGRIPGSESFWKGFRDTRHDVHALGAVYFQLLTGTPPFPGENAPQIITRILDRSDYARLVPAAEAVLPGAGAIIDRCIVWHDFGKPWQEQPAQFADAGALAAALETLFQSLAPGRTTEQVLAEFLTSANWLPDPAEAPAPTVPLHPATPAATPPPADLSQTGPRAGKIASALAILFALLLLGAGLALWKPWRHAERSAPPPLSAAPPAMQPAPPPASAVAAPAAAAKKKTRLRHAAARPAETVTADTIPMSAEGVPPQPAELDAQTFMNLQSEVRTHPQGALADLAAAQSLFPASADLDYLQCQAQATLEEWTPSLRKTVEALLSRRPAFLDIRLFRENLSYWRWRADLANYQQQPGDAAARESLARSANAYLSEFGKNPALRAKMTRIQTPSSP